MCIRGRRTTVVHEMHMHPDMRQALGRETERQTLAAAERSRLATSARIDKRNARALRVELKRQREAGREITIRVALPADTQALANLAILDSEPPLLGELLLAEVEGELWAACSLGDGRTIADPFRPTHAVRSLLQLRSEQLAATQRGEQLRSRRTRRVLRLLHIGS